MKFFKTIVICVASLMLLTSCNTEQNNSITDKKTEPLVNTVESSVDTNITETENISEITKLVNSAFSERGVSIGMTEAEVKEIENSIEFSVDPLLTKVNTEYTQKAIYSNDKIKFQGYDATITYLFIDDSLHMISYKIESNYTESELSSFPAYTIFLDFSLKYTDILGNPQISETNNDSSFYTSYLNVWYNEDNNYAVAISTNQSTYQSYIDEYNDTISISIGKNN